jgi:hypothetical protein
MNIKNYTTEVPANRSIEYIEKLLIEFGARNIMKEYSPEGKCAAMSFMIEMEGMKLPFRLPANADKIFAWLKKKKPQAQVKNLKEQAERIAWKQQYEWLHLQLGMIEMNQLEKLEAFFPYLYDINKQQSYYAKIKEGKFQNLLPSSTNQ